MSVWVSTESMISDRYLFSTVKLKCAVQIFGDYYGLKMTLIASALGMQNCTTNISAKFTRG